MKKLIKKSFGESLFLPVGIVIIVLLILLDSFNALSHLRYGISYLFEPISADASNTGGGIKKSFGSIINISEFREEYNNLKIQIYEKDVNNAYYQTLLEENNALRSQINLSSVEDKQILAKILGRDGFNKLRINVGSKNGVKEGDIVLLGNMYVGIVDKVDAYGSSVILASGKNSSLEVIISSIGVEQGKIVDSVPILSRAVASGAGEYISLENISMNSSVKDGDIVVVNDSKVGKYLVLGKVVGLSSNPAATSKSAKVLPLMEYSDLMTVFVSVK